MSTETPASPRPAADRPRPRPRRTTAARPAAKPRRTKGEGQWALGYREPLNANEQSKKDDNPLNVRARIENIYAHGGFASIDPGDLRGRFRWFGLYTQRKPGIDGGKTATLDPHELDDEYFMLRIRIDGGALTTDQLRVIGQISVDFARGTADITDRQNVQLHWIRVEDVPEIWRRLEAVGLEHHRGLRRLPARHPRLPGRRHRRRRDHRPDAGHRATSSSATSATRSTRTCRASSRPRSPATRCRTSSPRSTTSPSSASSTPSTAPASTCGSAAACPPTRCWPSGVGAWVPERGGRRGLGGRLRRLPRLRLPPAAHPGPDQVPRRRLGRGEVPPGARGRVPAPPPRRRPRPGGARPAPGTTSASTSRRTAKFFVGLSAVAGRTSGSALLALADVAEAHGSHPRPHHADAEAARARRRGRPGRVAVAGHRGARPVGPARRLAPLGDGLHRHRVLQAGHRRDQGARRHRRRRAGEPGWARWTPPSPSTSTAAPTPAPASRPPTSASRASWSRGRAASRSRASRSTWAAGSASTPASAASCAATR